jgi:hypothetical protein
MSELRYPNESREYRDARDSLLKEEQELVDKSKICGTKTPLLLIGLPLFAEFKANQLACP